MISFLTLFGAPGVTGPEVTSEIPLYVRYVAMQVMVFVNKIARIVHHCVNEWNGTTNKNIGDAFFVVWLADDEETEGV